MHNLSDTTDAKSANWGTIRPARRAGSHYQPSVHQILVVKMPTAQRDLKPLRKLTPTSHSSDCFTFLESFVHSEKATILYYTTILYYYMISMQCSEMVDILSVCATVLTGSWSWMCLKTPSSPVNIAWPLHIFCPQKTFSVWLHVHGDLTEDRLLIQYSC